MSPSKFRTIVDVEKKFLTELCEKWEKVLTIAEDTGESTTTQDREGPPSSRTRSKTANTLTNGDMDASQPANEQQQSLPNIEDKPASTGLPTVLPSIDDELIGLVRATTGQGRMLLEQRFVQFNKLIDDAENKTSEKPICDNDLQGFWEMIGFQVNDMKEKFQVLEQAEGNEWKLPEKTKDPPKPAPAPKQKMAKPAPSSNSRTKKAAPSSGMKDFIAQMRLEAAAARKKAQEAAAAGN